MNKRHAFSVLDRRRKMKKSICGADCGACEMKESCRGCCESQGKHFGEKCVIAAYQEKGDKAFTGFKQQLMNAFNALNIPDLPPITELYALRGAFINLEYPLPGGQKCKFWHDDKIYLGTQVEKKDGVKCYGLAADEEYLMVSQYAPNGADAEVVIFKRWRESSAMKR